MFGIALFAELGVWQGITKLSNVLECGWPHSRFNNDFNSFYFIDNRRTSHPAKVKAKNLPPIVKGISDF